MPARLRCEVKENIFERFNKATLPIFYNQARRITATRGASRKAMHGAKLAMQSKEA